MARKLSPTVDAIGPWSQAKLDLLEKYIKTYSGILNYQREHHGWLKGYYYIDAFTGSLTPIDKDSGEYLDGSPRRALKAEPHFDGYFFIELNPERFQRAESLRGDFVHRNIFIFNGDCNEVLKSSIIPKFGKRTGTRALCFLDPYGLSVQWETVVCLARTEAIDVFFNFPIMGLTRNLPREKEPEDCQKRLISSVLGDEEWIDEFYYKGETQFNLFGGESTPTCRVEEIADKLTTRYLKKLKTIFPNVSRAVTMTTSTNAPLYALLLASHKEVAIKRMNQLFAKFGDYRRSGR